MAPKAAAAAAGPPVAAAMPAPPVPATRGGRRRALSVGAAAFAPTLEPPAVRPRRAQVADNQECQLCNRLKSTVGFSIVH